MLLNKQRQGFLLTAVLLYINDFYNWNPLKEFHMNSSFDHFFLIHLCAKGHQSKFRQLELLQAKGNPNDRNAQHCSQCQMLQCQRQTGYNKPNDIQQEGTCSAAILHLLPKRKEAKPGKLKALKANWDTYNRNTPKAACQTPTQSTDCSAKYKP